jgi:3-hydroxyisobutyrate dehydrogenase-like beta-hydroxyacid dehydrogenase
VRVAVFHPGAMGSRLAGQLVAAGHHVSWVPEGRSTASAERAAAQGLIGVPFDEAVDTADLVLCSCAPQGAIDVAREVGDEGFAGIYVDANPLSPDSLQQAADAVPSATFVDAGVIGPPPRDGAGATHLMLSGDTEATALVRDLFAPTLVTPMVVGDRIGAASAAKSSFALYNKGHLALAALARSLAKQHGVLDALEAQAVRKDASLLADADRIDGLGAVAWRWGPEFDELADTLDDAGLEGDALRGLRQVWTRLAGDTER